MTLGGYAHHVGRINLSTRKITYEDIPEEWLLQAGYCSDLSDCATRKGSNQLCRGHYSYAVTFQKTY